MYNDSGAGAAVGIMIITIIWLLLAVGIIVWYLWAMARLFPRIGLKSTDGWIPIWNQWKLLERAGLPGWVVLLSFVGFSIVPFIFLIIAMHRINTQYGAGTGYTVLGVFIAPLWAMLLANHIDKTAPVRAGGVAAGQYAPRPGAPQPGVPAVGQPVAGQPGVGAHGAHGAQPGAQPAGQPAAQHGAQPMGQPAYAPGTLASHPVQPPAPHNAGAQPATQVFAPPPPPPAAGVTPPAAQSVAPAAPPAAGSAAKQPWAAAESVVTPPTGGAATPASPSPAAPAPGSSPAGPLGGDTEAEYQRLASEAFQAPPAVPLGQQSAPAPFSWTAASRPVQAPVPPPAAPAPPVHPFAAAPPAPAGSVAPVPPAPVPPAAGMPPAPPAAPVAPPAAQPVQPATAPPTAPAPVIPPPPPAPVAVATEAMQPQAASLNQTDSAPISPHAPSTPATTYGKHAVVTPAAASSVFKPTGITGRSAIDDATIITGSNSEDLDRTIVVARKPSFNWVLELADGTELNLENDTIVGRRPEAIDGAFALAIPDATRTLSKSHARLRFDGDVWTIEDLGSTNGLVLISDSGAETELAPRVPTQATTRLLLGTLEVKLRPGGDAA